MSKLYVQNQQAVWSRTGSLAATGSVSSGSFATNGYARLTGITYTSASMTKLRIYQSFNAGSTWDYFTDYAPTENSACGYALELVGNAVSIAACMGAVANASSFRTGWFLRPI